MLLLNFSTSTTQMTLSLAIAVVFFVCFASGQAGRVFNCTVDEQCGGVSVGRCVDETCYCPIHMAGPDCSYHKKSTWYGGLQFLCFVSLPGLGDVYAGNDGHAAGQAIFMWLGLIGLIPVIISYIAITKNMESCICIDHRTGGVTIAVIGGTLWLTGFLWALYRGANMLGGNLLDGNGQAMFTPM